MRINHKSPFYQSPLFMYKGGTIPKTTPGLMHTSSNPLASLAFVAVSMGTNSLSDELYLWGTSAVDFPLYNVPFNAVRPTIIDMGDHVFSTRHLNLKKSNLEDICGRGTLLNVHIATHTCPNYTSKSIVRHPYT